jgi:hypothetical protein
MEFSESDFESVPYKVYPPTQTIDYLKKYARLRDVFKEFEKPCEKFGGVNRVIRYIITLYDQESPLHKKQWRDPKQKKVQAAILATFSYEEKRGGFEDYVKEILANNNKTVCAMIVLYLREHFSVLWTSYSIYYETFFKAAESLLMNDASKSLLANFKEAKNQLNEALLEISRGDSASDNVASAFYMVAEEERKGYRPEEIIRKMRAGEYVGVSSKKV